MFLKHKIVSMETVISAYTHRQCHPHAQAFWPYKAKIYTAQNGQQMPRRPGMDEDISMEQETCQVYSFGKRNVSRLGLNESREGFCWRGRGRSFHVEGPTSKPNKQKKHRLANLFFPLACWIKNTKTDPAEGFLGNSSHIYQGSRFLGGVLQTSENPPVLWMTLHLVSCPRSFFL